MNIATLLRRAAADHPSAVALALDEAETGYAAFADRAARFAAHLLRRGTVPGDRVGFFLPNHPDYLVGLLGTWQVGAVAVPLNALFPDAALRHAIADSSPALLVVPESEAGRVRGLAPDGTALLGLGAEFDAAVAAEEPAPGVVPRLDGDDALIMYTSGSTGPPKGVRQTHRNTFAQVEAVIDLYGITADDHVLNCLPLFHVGGLQLASLPVLARGGRVTFMPRWDAVAWLDLAQRLRPTYGGLISTMMIDVGNRTVDAPVVLDSFRICMFGGSRTPTAAIDRLAAGTGIAGTEIYGQTEQSGLVVSYAPGEQRRPGAMGRPLAQIVATRLVSPSTGADVTGPGEVGELWVRGDAVTPGYRNLPELTAARFTDGWFRTGDLVSADDEGYLYYTDRIDDMIVTGGENVFPQMVEEHLAGHPDLAEVAVIGTPHERWVEQVTAVVVANRPGVSAEDVAAWCATHPDLRGVARPRRIEIVEELPRTGSGKLDRPSLRRWF